MPFHSHFRIASDSRLGSDAAPSLPHAPRLGAKRTKPNDRPPLPLPGLLGLSDRGPPRGGDRPVAVCDESSHSPDDPDNAAPEGAEARDRCPVEYETRRRKWL